MELDYKRYISTLWTRITEPKTRESNRDLAQKLETLARDLAAVRTDTFPSGAVVFWIGDASTIPAGWSRVTALDGKFPRGMTGTTGAGATGGSDTHSHSMNHTHTGATGTTGSAHLHTITTDTHSHSISTDTHSHTVGLVVGYAGGGSFNANDVNNTGSTSHNHGGSSGSTSHSHGGLTGGGSVEGLHSHDITINPLTATTGTQSTLPSYVDGIWIRKD